MYGVQGLKSKKVIRKVYEPLFPAFTKEKVLMIPLKMASSDLQYEFLLDIPLRCYT